MLTTLIYKPYSEEYVSTMKLMDREVKDRIINAAGRKLEVAFLMSTSTYRSCVIYTLNYFGKGKVVTENNGWKIDKLITTMISLYMTPCVVKTGYQLPEHNWVSAHHTCNVRPFFRPRCVSVSYQNRCSLSLPSRTLPLSLVASFSTAGICLLNL